MEQNRTVGLPAIFLVVLTAVSLCGYELYRMERQKEISIAVNEALLKEQKIEYILQSTNLNYKTGTLSTTDLGAYHGRSALKDCEQAANELIAATKMRSWCKISRESSAVN